MTDTSGSTPPDDGLFPAHPVSGRRPTVSGPVDPVPAVANH
ncbi:hypothetical protein [Actinomycetospora chiangmaiensis]|nr:hypothetical protein [Actinomycetospora chiangmaiensis]